ncbi:MAG: hypothetical protein ACMG55_02790 [Microcoleus sp.]
MTNLEIFEGRRKKEEGRRKSRNEKFLEKYRQFYSDAPDKLSLV